MAIELKNVFFSYPDGTKAIQDISITIGEGERVAIVGKNGAGKTTAVKLMNAIYKPTEGAVLIDGVDTKDKTTAQIAKYVGYVFQNPDDQIFNKDVKTEIEYMPRYFKMPEEEVRQRVDRALALTGTKSYLKKNPFDIPYPIRKFVTIAAVLATKPKYLILDEPTAGQDKYGTDLLVNLMDELEKEGISVITITHDMEFVANNFNRVVVMAHANIIAEGTTREIFWNDQVIAEAGILKPQLGDLAEKLGLPGQLLYDDEIIAAID